MSVAWAIALASLLAQADPATTTGALSAQVLPMNAPAEVASPMVAATSSAAPAEKSVMDAPADTASVLAPAAATVAPDEHVKDVQIKVTLEPNEIPFHKQAQLRIDVESPNAIDVTFPKIAEEIAPLAIYGPPKRTETLLDNGRKRLTETYAIDAIFAQDYPIQPIEVAWGGATRMLAPAPALRVRALNDAEKAAIGQFAPNAGPIDPPRHWPKRWIAAGGAALALAALLAVWVVRRRRKTPAPAPVVPPWERAYAQLRALDERHLPEQGEYDAFYVELSGVLRYYIEGRFRLHAPEQTTPEFLAEAGQLGVLSPEHQRLLATFLRHCDRVKFAQYQPGVPEMEQGFTAVLRFVDETVPQAPSSPDASQGDAA